MVKYKKIPLSIGILSWRRPSLLRANLSLIKDAKIDLYTDLFVIAQQANNSHEEICRYYNIPLKPFKDNLGIAGGIKRVFEQSKNENVLHLEEDIIISRNPQEVLNTIETAYTALTTKKADVCFLRDLENPGNNFDMTKYQKMWKVGETNLCPTLKGKIRPSKAKKTKGLGLYDPLLSQDKKDIIFKKSPLGYQLSSKNLNWTNQAFMTSKKFMFETILPYVYEKPTTRLVNGYPDIERSLNSRWWRKKNFKLLHTNGCFTHIG
ncbi:MAG: hypothetical protein CMM87_04765 [Rickettsiales bacterium]|nr:hypothetical protein [Rickettsiales bacterium]|tara:strand:+ start:13414 stop:14205 length:792 start_codon:yes stop_codon:yes gene_type:complete